MAEPCRRRKGTSRVSASTAKPRSCALQAEGPVASASWCKLYAVLKWSSVLLLERCWARKVVLKAFPRKALSSYHKGASFKQCVMQPVTSWGRGLVRGNGWGTGLKNNGRDHFCPCSLSPNPLNFPPGWGQAANSGAFSLSLAGAGLVIQTVRAPA
jgi:hypothetical protein